MQLRTYTGLWNVEKRLYKFYDIDLPYPVSLKQLGILFVVSVPWIFVMSTLKVPFGPPIGYILWLAPPLGLAWYGNKPVAEGKKLPNYVYSQLKFFLGFRRYAALTATGGDGARHSVTAQSWRLKGNVEPADIMKVVHVQKLQEV